MKILLFGHKGQIGWELRRSLCLLGNVIVIGNNAEENPEGLCGDFRDSEGVAATVRAVRPDIIINAAGYTDVESAEVERDLAFQINAITPEILAKESNKFGAWMVHYSSDYVFNGHGHRPWRESDMLDPVNVYGRSKAEGDCLIRLANSRHVIIRTSWIHSARRKNFIKTILGLASQNQTLSIINDQWGAPTGADLLADVTAFIIPQILDDGGKAGVYHCAAAGATTWHEYAQFILATGVGFGKSFQTAENRILPISTLEFKTKVARPLNSRLDCKKIEDSFGFKLPKWQVGVTRSIATITQI
jgi:dTDP-4-dehydrorhamnose reductase